MGVLEFFMMGFDFWVFMDVMVLMFVLFLNMEEEDILMRGSSNFLMILMEILEFICYEMGGRLVFMYFSFYIVLSIVVFSLCLSGVSFYGNSLPSYFGLSFWVSFVLWFTLVMVGELMVLHRMYELYRLDIMPRLVFALCMMEAFSFVLRLVSLAVRLSANLVSGHLLLFFMVVLYLVVVHDIFLMSVMGLSLVPFLFYMTVEVGVCVVQSYMMGFLTLMYMNSILD